MPELFDFQCEREFMAKLHLCPITYSRGPIPSTSDRLVGGWVASAAPFAALRTAPAGYLARRWHSSPRDDDSPRDSLLSLLVRYR